MIQFTFESFYMSVIFSNLMILLLYLIFRKEALMTKIGVSAIGISFLVIIVRMAFPYELLFLSNNIHFTGLPALIVGAIPVEHFFDERLSVWSFLMMAWLIGAVIVFVRFIKEERSLAAIIKASRREFSPASDVGKVFEQIQKEFPKLRRVQVCTFSRCESPFIYGIWKPCIFLPEGMRLDEKELYYVLRHEASHYLCHDLYLKLFVRCLCIIYWWNPICYFLKKKVDTLLEMRVDHSIAKEPEQKAAYLKCLLSVADYVTGKNRAAGSVCIVSFCGESSTELKQRFQMLINEEKKLSYKLVRSAFLFGVAALFLLSYVYIFEPLYIHPEDMIGVITPGPDNAFFIERNDGSYDFYLEGKYVSTEDSLDYFNDDIPIYKEGIVLE